MQPGLGVRMRLASIGAGKWQNSGGDKAKFGLSPRQVLDLVDAAARPPACSMRCSCCTSTWARRSPTCATSPTACARRCATSSSCRRLGCHIRYMDSGGGLGVDYEGTRSRGFCSINYGLDQFAHTLVQPLAEACAEFTAARRR